MRGFQEMMSLLSILSSVQSGSAGDSGEGVHMCECVCTHTFCSCQSWYILMWFLSCYSAGTDRGTNLLTWLKDTFTKTHVRESRLRVPLLHYETIASDDTTELYRRLPAGGHSGCDTEVTSCITGDWKEDEEEEEEYDKINNHIPLIIVHKYTLCLWDMLSVF